MIIVTVGGNPTPVWTALRFHLDAELRACVLVHTEQTRAVAERLLRGLRARPGCGDLPHQLVQVDPLATGTDLGALDGLPLPLGLDAAVDVSGGTKLMAARVADWAQARGLRDDLLTTVPEPGRIRRPFEGEGIEYPVNSTVTVEELVSLHCDGQLVTFGLPDALDDDELRGEAAAYFAKRISAWTPGPGDAAEPESCPDLPTVAGQGPDEQHWNGAFHPHAGRSNPTGKRWFELALLLALAQDSHSRYHDLRTSVTMGPDDKPRFEVDVVGTRAGRLWAFSATTSQLGSDSGLTDRGWEKVTEVVVRARHLGGEDAQAVVITVQPDAQLRGARAEVERIFRGQRPPILVGGDQVVGALRRGDQLPPARREMPPSLVVLPAAPPPVGQCVDLVVAVGDNAMPVAEVIAAHDARSTLLLVSDRTRRVAKKLITTLGGVRRLYVQLVKDPYDAASVQQELRDSGVHTRAVDLTGGTKPTVLGLWRWAAAQGTATEATYVPAGSPEMVGVGPSPPRPLPTLPFKDTVQPLSNLSAFPLTPAAAQASPGLGQLRGWWGPATGGWAEPVSLDDRVGLWRLFAPERDQFWLLLLGLHGRQWIVGDVTALGAARSAQKQQNRVNTVRRAVIALDCLAADALGSAAIPVVIGDPDVVGTEIGPAASPKTRRERDTFIARLRDDWRSPRRAQVLCPADLACLADPMSAESRHLVRVLCALP